ncbi:ABC transporter substrate-binding protein [Schaalia sp. 19OD2882]|nr:ABC transporter substrate-binding protein [Schaalia sp. 19OD2882]
MDWTPNTNHTGVFVAQERGYYRQENLEVEILPFNKAGVEAVLATGGADFGFSGAPWTTQANVNGQDVQMVLTLMRKPAVAIAVKADNPSISSPKDLDGRTFASWGSSELVGSVREMIRADGGTGTFDQVMLGTSAYEAVHSGTADFAQGLVTWEGIEADLRGTPLRFFRPADFGVPLVPSEVGIASTRTYLADHSQVARRFLRATRRGYEDAVKDPAGTADVLVAANPQAKIDPELARCSQQLLSTEYWPDEDGRVGRCDRDAWQAYLDHLVDKGYLVDSTGAPVTVAPKVDDLVTNEYLE